jgi:hypothetical protein
MHVTENPPLTPPASEAPTVVAGASQTHQLCDECGAPVDAAQRYCVACGAHRRHVDDPAARYLSRATARGRGAPPAGTAPRPSRSRTRGLGTALLLAVIPVAVAVGVMVGRSSNNQDSQLIQALARRQGAVVAAGSTTSAGQSTSTVAATRKVSHARPSHRAKWTAHATNATPSTKNAGKVISTTQYGSAQQITGFKPTRSEQQQGAQATQQVQKSKGQSYVNSQSNLPSQVVVP